jgi:hypothetical protein
MVGRVRAIHLINVEALAHWGLLLQNKILLMCNDYGTHCYPSNRDIDYKQPGRGDRMLSLT